MRVLTMGQPNKPLERVIAIDRRRIRLKKKYGTITRLKSDDLSAYRRLLGWHLAALINDSGKENVENEKSAIVLVAAQRPMLPLTLIN